MLFNSVIADYNVVKAELYSLCAMWYILTDTVTRRNQIVDRVISVLGGQKSFTRIALPIL